MHSSDNHVQGREQVTVTPTQVGRNTNLLRSYVACFRRNEEDDLYGEVVISIFEALWLVYKADPHCTLGRKVGGQIDTHREFYV